MLSTKKLAEIHAKGQTIGQWQKNRQKTQKRVSVVLFLVLFLGLGSMFRNFNFTSAPTGEESTTIADQTADDAVGEPLENQRAIAVFVSAAKAAGWSQSQLRLEHEVNPLLDRSKAGRRPFYEQGFKTPAEAIDWLKIGSLEAKGVIYLIIAYTGCTEEELFNAANWITAQPTVSFSYKEMTLFKNGTIKTQAGYKGEAGDIFVAFVAPRSDKIAIVRSGCANPTLFIPTPDEPAPVTTMTTAPSEEETAPPVTKPGETTVPETKPPKTTKPETTKAPKDPSKDVLTNPKVADWKKNGGELLTILWDTEASNGLQIDPIKDAAEKAAAIAAANELLRKEHESALTTAVVVDSNQGHGSVTPTQPTGSGTTVPWSPFG